MKYSLIFFAMVGISPAFAHDTTLPHTHDLAPTLLISALAVTLAVALCRLIQQGVRR